MSQSKSKKYPPKRKQQNAPWTPIVVVLGGVVLIILAFFALREKPMPAATIEVTGAPSLKVDKDQIDLGNMKFNRAAEVSFRLTNVGDQTLRFSEAPYIEVAEGC